jgi:hypothetical protein
MRSSDIFLFHEFQIKIENFFSQHLIWLSTRGQVLLDHEKFSISVNDNGIRDISTMYGIASPPLFSLPFRWVSSK